MAKAALKRFSRRETLTAISPGLLREFLDRFPETPAAKLVAGVPDDEIDFDALAAELAKVPSEEWGEMSEALLEVDILATDTGRDDILALLAATPSQHQRPAPSPSDSPADVAILTWLNRPDIIRAALDHKVLRHSRQFQAFAPAAGNARRASLDEAHLDGLRKALRDHHEVAGGQPGTRLQVVDSGDDEVWFLIPHGQPLERWVTVSGDHRATNAGHLEGADVVIYARRWGALRVRANREANVEAYRRLFGEHLFDSPEYFSEDGLFTLEPLRTKREGVLTTGGIPGLLSVRLTRLQVAGRSKYREFTTFGATDLFELWRERGRDFFPFGRLVSATFEFTLKADKRPSRRRSMTIKTPGTAKISQDRDGTLITAWTQANGICAEDAPGAAPSFWSTFDRLGVLEATPEEWGRALGDDWALAYDWFHPTGKLAETLPCGLGRPDCNRKVERAADDLVARCCGGDGARCGDVAVSEDEATPHRFNLAEFQESMQRLLGLMPVAGQQSRTARIGVTPLAPGRPTDVYLCLEAPNDLSDTLLRLLAENPVEAVVLAPRWSNLDAGAQRLLDHRGWLTIDLERTVILGPRKRLKLASEVGEMFLPLRDRLRGRLGADRQPAKAEAHAFLVHRDERNGEQKQTYITLAEYDALAARADLDVLIDFLSGHATSPSGNWAEPPAKFKGRPIAESVRRLVCSTRGLRLTELGLSGNDDQERRSRLSRFTGPLRSVSNVEWVTSEGETGARTITWRPPVGWSYALVFSRIPSESSAT